VIYPKHFPYIRISLILFNPATTIRFVIPDLKVGLINVNLDIYNISGEKIKSLVLGPLTHRMYQVEWNATDAAGQKYLPGFIFIIFVPTSFHLQAR